MKKFWKKKDKSMLRISFEDYTDGSGSFSTEYSQTPSAVTSGPIQSNTHENEKIYNHSTQASAAVAAKQTNSSRYQQDFTQDRQNLFIGYNEPAKTYDPNGQEDYYENSRLAEPDEDQKVVQIQHTIRNVKQDTLQSTRNALQKIGEVESAASNTMNMLGTQSSM